MTNEIKSEFDIGDDNKLTFEYTQDLVDKSEANGIDLLKEIQIAADKFAELLKKSPHDITDPEGNKS